MLIISNDNNNSSTNKLNVYISDPVTINHLLNHNEEIAEFFDLPEYTDPESILDSLVSIDGLDAGAIRNPGSILIDNDTSLEFCIFGSTENVSSNTTNDSAKVADTGTVTVTISGSFAHKSVAVTNNVTRAGDLITDNLADFFATTRCALSNMSVRINDVEAASTDTVKSGDVVTFEVRKAGSKGSVFNVNVRKNGVTKSYACCPECTLSSFVYKLQETLNMPLVVSSYNGKEIPSDFYSAVIHSIVMHKDDEIVIYSPEEKAVNDEAHVSEEHEIDEVGDEAVNEEREEQEAEDSHEHFTAGSVTVVLPGGFNKIKIAISNGKTNVNDVVMSTKVWDALAMNSTQVASLVFHVNDVEVSLEDSLEDGDVISISARKAGSKGC